MLATPPPLTVSVIICAYAAARWDALWAAVGSVQNQTRPALELIVVIDHNPSLLARARAALPGVLVLENEQARGLSGARNTGVRVARGEVLAFLDDDACAAVDWLEHLLAGYRSAQIVGVGGWIEPVWAAQRPAWFPEEFDWVVGCSYRGLPTAAGPVRNLIGANMSLRRSVFAAVGGFQSGLGRRAQLPAGCEETELCIRARQHQPEAVMHFEPAALVSHRVPAERSHWRYFFARCYAEGRSKALVARLVGASEGLSSERAYVRRTLPEALWRSLQRLVQHQDWTALGRASAILAGVATTAAGYVVGTLAALLPPWAEKRRAPGRVRAP